MTTGNHLYPDWAGPAVALPAWVSQYGLSRFKPLISRVYASAPKWVQADADGIANVTPIIVRYNLHPHQIKEQIGGEYWKRIHHAKLKTNLDRMVMMMVAGWSLDEAMLFPEKEQKRGLWLTKAEKGPALLACNLAEKRGELLEFLTMATDLRRMGGVIDPGWGRKRLKREHDAAAIKMMMERSDPTPWAKPWFCDVGAYSFRLLTSEAELAIEGITQRHCCRSYAKDCRTGKEVVMQIEGPERATCSWRPGLADIQVKLFANNAPSKETVMAARAARANFTAFQERSKA